MSRAWSEKNGVAQPQDYNGKQETYAVRNANGTGPYMLKAYEQDRRLVLVENPNWWGRSDKAIGAQLERRLLQRQLRPPRRGAGASCGQGDGTA